ncbi:MAG: hypothetical protein EOP02_37045, partial [Proteobacteria bacterium]
MRKQVMVLSIQAALLGTLSLASSQAALAQEATTPTETVDLETVQVTGSRIPRSQVEGPAPITVITAEQIQAAGHT